MVDLAAVYSAAMFSEPARQSLRDFPRDLLSLIRSGPWAWEAARQALEFVKKRRAVPVGEQLVFPMEEVKVLAPLVRPGKIICIRDVRVDGAEPVLDFKLPNTVVGPGDPIVKPIRAKHLESRPKVAAVIGRGMKNASEDEVSKGIFGFTLLNDVSMKAPESDGVFGSTLAMNCDSFCPVGPYILTADELRENSGLELRCFLNGIAVKQAGIVGLHQSLVSSASWISQVITLEPGDLIALPPAEWTEALILRRGDVMKIEAEAFGTLENGVIE
jgi:acylpyruvate hydrolase